VGSRTSTSGPSLQNSFSTPQALPIRPVARSASSAGGFVSDPTHSALFTASLSFPWASSSPFLLLSSLAEDRPTLRTSARFSLLLQHPRRSSHETCTILSCCNRTRSALCYGHPRQ